MPSTLSAPTGASASKALSYMPRSMRLSTTSTALTTTYLTVAALLVPMAMAHEHAVENIPDEAATSLEPIDSTLWAHIFVNMMVFGVLYPVGMILGMTKSRWHVPVQVLATVVALLGYVLGHMHGGRQFRPDNVHAKFANWVYLQMFVQLILGVYLKLHLEKGFNKRIRPVIRTIHSINGKAFPIVCWTQMLFGGITALGFCQGDHLGQCLAHFIMGSAFIAYGILLTIALLVGQLWIRRTGRSQEFFDSVVIAAWGCVNTFTEHRWGTAWVKNDWQHTTMGIVWWCAGLAGVWLSRDREGRPKRNFIPGFVIAITGWAMSAHPQELMISAMTHKAFGYSLMGAGLTRIIEVCFVLHDKVGISEDGYETHSFQYIPPFLLYASGFLFMGATEEQMTLVNASGIDHVAYVLILYSLAFLLFLFTNVLINMYDRSVNQNGQMKGINGHVQGGNGRAVGSTTADERRLRDAEEFELDDMMSDEEDEDQAQRRKLLKEEDGEKDEGENEGLSSPSTVGRNNDRVA
ncbi:Protein YTP1 [Cytospora mali]|uniref:Protein YTP1 n=1 Tax=Cytospora mali TaxID=578113 RepID=A0A194VG08_CYTMA|nr:Protein YTP1 [Valsa mali var. pyri (nom. inval.)]